MILLVCLQTYYSETLYQQVSHCPTQPWNRDLWLAVRKSYKTEPVQAFKKNRQKLKHYLYERHILTLLDTCSLAAASRRNRTIHTHRCWCWKKCF
jgi:hypothetical protein